MTVRLVFGLIFFGALLLIWRRIGLQKRNGEFVFQTMIHKYRYPLPILLQWYILSSIALLFMAVMVFTQVGLQIEDTNWLVEEASEAHFNENQAHLLADRVYWDLHPTPGVNSSDYVKELEARFEIPSWLRWLSVISPFVGAVCALFVACHMVIIIRSGQSYEIEEGYEILASDHTDDSINNPWRLSKRQDMVLFLTVMPLIYVLMSVRSTSRMWSIMSLEHDGKAAILDNALFTENLEAASVFQYYVVMEFAHLCNSFIKSRASIEIRWAMKFVGFLGVYSWVFVGVIKAIITFAEAFLSIRANWVAVLRMDEDEFADKITNLQSKISIVFSVLTMLCVYNMLVICRMKYIKDALGNANMKFLGVRILLLAGQVQEKVIVFMADRADTWPFSLADLSSERGKLLHASLLSYECLLVALFNIYAWELDMPAKNNNSVRLSNKLGNKLGNNYVKKLFSKRQSRIFEEYPETKQANFLIWTCYKCQRTASLLELQESQMACSYCGSPSGVSS
eukprot:TRINITY_DN24864_c0_g1_i1.p1 TRINITY_DN24864_c0_g1~~TRINITY_DN24864_c0_g1_i1.p1  ORF type:complete len:528 (+),score=76.76 TRINITY_DN24864_c0_g1_i1:55-1584(+)